jgi:spore coat protein U-like protein
MRSTYVKRRGALVMALALAATASTAQATTTVTSTFQVSLTIASNCVIAANPLAFGTSGVLTSNVNQTTTVSVTCSNTTPYNVGLDGGNVSGSTVGTRLLSNGTASVQFQLYSDSGRSVVWGNTLGTNTVSGTGNGSAQTLTVYGQVPPQTTPTASTYNTTVTASVTF